MSEYLFARQDEKNQNNGCHKRGLERGSAFFRWILVPSDGDKHGDGADGVDHGEKKNKDCDEVDHG